MTKTSTSSLTRSGKSRRQENKDLLDRLNAAYADGDPEGKEEVERMMPLQREVVEGEW